MSYLTRRDDVSSQEVSARDLSLTRPHPGVQRAVERGVTVEHGRGLVQAARVRALEYVSHEALQAVAGLTELETLYVQRAPLGEARYRAITDVAACALANIVAEAGRR